MRFHRRFIQPHGGSFAGARRLRLALFNLLDGPYLLCAVELAELGVLIEGELRSLARGVQVRVGVLRVVARDALLVRGAGFPRPAR